MFTALAASALALSAITTPGSVAPAEAPPEQVTISIVTVNGSGCPAGTSAVAVSPDNTNFTVPYSDYLAQTGASPSSPIEFRKNCQLNLRINAPSGFTYGIAQADYCGFARLTKGAYGFQRATYYFQGQSANASAVHPYSDNWQDTDKTDFASIPYAPCIQESPPPGVEIPGKVCACSARWPLPHWQCPS